MKNVLMTISVVGALLVPCAALAQVAPPEKAFVRPLVGATLGAGPGALFGATFGMKAGPKLQITGELGGMTNILPPSVADDVDVAAAIVADSKGGKHSSSASARATYGLVGIRRALREVSGAMTFVEFGVGAATVRSTVSAQIRGSEALQGDISNLVSTPFTAATPTTNAMFSVGGGIILGVTRTTAVEVGYRYARIFTDNPAINMSNIVGGFRFGF
jgi:opacity protein-like surface antigen